MKESTHFCGDADRTQATKPGGSTTASPHAMVAYWDEGIEIIGYKATLKYETHKLNDDLNEQKDTDQNSNLPISSIYTIYAKNENG